MSVATLRLKQDGVSTPAERGTGRPTILLAEPDPYLAFLIHLNVPGAEVVEAGPDADPTPLIEAGADLVIVNLDGPRASEFIARAGGAKVLGVLDGGHPTGAPVPPEVEGVLVRPFLPAELHRAVRRALGLPEASRRSRASERSWIGVARLAGVALASVLDIATTARSPARAAILSAAFTYATARLALRGVGRRGMWADAGVATVLVALTGGLSSNYMPYALATCVAVGLMLGVRAGALSGAAVAAGSAHSLVASFVDGPARPQQAAAWVALLTLAGIAGGLAARTRRSVRLEGLGLLVEANQVLSTLHHLARAMPGGLEIGTVASAVMDEVRDAMRAPAAALLVGDMGGLRPAASFGLADPDGLSAGRPGCALARAAEGRGPQVVSRDDVHPLNAAALGEHPCWHAAPLRQSSEVLGLLVIACADHGRHHRDGALLGDLAREVAVAIDNAQLFRRVREFSIDEERQRLAREMHDGVAQALTHLRLELDFMARHPKDDPQDTRRELERLSRVVDRAGGDVRSMILGLRSAMSAEGLAGALRSYLRDLRGLGGPDISFEVGGSLRLRPEIESEIFRIGQEAIWNSLRHARARTLRVSLYGGETILRLVVEDDGVGLGADADASKRGGVGLKAMRERAERIKAHISVVERPTGGTRVELACPTNGWRIA